MPWAGAGNRQAIGYVREILQSYKLHIDYLQYNANDYNLKFFGNWVEWNRGGCRKSATVSAAERRPAVGGI
jgi:hypothetical protein